MPADLTLLSVVGARPQFVKLAPVCRVLAATEGVAHRVVHTGQHYDDNMSASFFEQLEIPEPDLNLDVGSGSQAGQTAAMLTALESILEDERPRAVLTYGDTNSTLAATLAASKLHVPLAHIEAGLRSFNRQMPEEVNRVIADHCSDRLYAPTPAAMGNLERENLSERAILTGDIMRDAVSGNLALARRHSHVLDDLGLEPGAFGLVTIHRPANTTDEALGALLAALESTSAEHLALVFPAHPRTRAAMVRIGYRPPAPLRIIDPQPYLDMLRLVHAAAIIITDSGGLQKEAAFLGTPCLTVRDETEWIETVAIGVNRLVGYRGSRLVEAVADALGRNDWFNQEQTREINRHYGPGNAAGKIVADCMDWLS